MSVRGAGTGTGGSTRNLGIGRPKGLGPSGSTVIGHSIGGDAAVYSATRYYLRAIEAAGTDEAKAVMAKMREIPINDFSAKSGCNFRRGKEVSPRSKSL